MKITDIIKDDKRLFLKDDVPKEYLNDHYLGQLKPIYGVALVKSHQEVVDLVKFANQNDLIIIPRGANTGVAGSQTPVFGNEIIIDFKLMNNILDLDEETMTLTVEPGVLLGDIHNFVEEKGYFYPPDPASKHSSIGGNVATNAGGLRAVKYGTTRDYIRELTVVLASGETLKLGGLNIKNSSGYNLLHLFIGSEGTLGISTEIKLKLIAKPKKALSILMAFDDVVLASKATIEILKSSAKPSEIELFEKDTIIYAEKQLGYNLATQKGQAYLLVEVDGNSEDEIITQLNTIKAVSKDYLLEAVLLTDKEKMFEVKKLRDNILIGLMHYTQYEMLDEVVPINQFAKLIEYTKKLEEKHKIKVVNFGHSGDGNVHTVLMKKDLSEDEWLKRRKHLLDDLYEKVYQLGGLISAEHGIGVLKKDYFVKKSDKTYLKYLKELKSVFDKKNILNPNKVF